MESTDRATDGRVVGAPPDAGNVLLLEPEGSSCVASTAWGDATAVRLLVVAYGGLSEGWIEESVGNVDYEPSRAACVVVGERTRGAIIDGTLAGSVRGVGAYHRGSSTGTDGHRGTTGLDVDVTVVEDRDDVSAVGAAILDRIEDWEDDDGRVVMCFHSVSALLRDVDVESAFQFLLLLKWQIERVDGFAHYHVDPDEVDEWTLGTLSTLFDATVDPNTPGGRGGRDP